MKDWEAVATRLEYESEHAVQKQLREDIKAALERVEELESHWKDFMTWGESAVMYDWKNRAEAAEAKLARLTNAVESYRRTYLVSMSGTHLGDPAVEIFAAAAKGEK